MRNTFIILFFLAALSLSGQSSFSSDRPGQSYSPLSLGLHEIQWQQGFQWKDFPAGDVVTLRSLSSVTELRYGLGSNFELGMAYGLNYTNQPILDDEFDFTTTRLQLQARYSFSKAEDPLQWGLLLRSDLETHDLRAMASMGLGAWSISGNLGLQNSPFVDYSVFWTINLAYSKDKWTTYVELYGITLNSANSDYIAVDAGFAFMLSPHFQWDIFAGNEAGIGPAVGVYSTYYFNTGFTWRIR